MSQNDPTPTLPLPGEGVRRPDAVTPPPGKGEAGRGSYFQPQSLFNPRYLKQRRQDLRNNLTDPEKRLWQKLRGSQLGVKFRRQHGIGHYIADFYCASCSLVIEVDGDSHYTPDALEYDRERNNYMQSLGIDVIRFSNEEVMKNIDGVLQAIQKQIVKNGERQ
ncbi:endonuclease domain-containing protein [Hahella sp. HN01]|uniref:endonuclease domain-containing protein n=1 Tax=Hahella sp. HN01 TaxID=2847262 RepID=UPI001C1ED137|nr:endonuclease domain-containing protein [Hahella sp. HN01]MBU6955031.1 endonuclease domain-containing protein [Hahella sp. HN01]